MKKPSVVKEGSTPSPHITMVVYGNPSESGFLQTRFPGNFFRLKEALKVCFQKATCGAFESLSLHLLKWKNKKEMVKEVGYWKIGFEEDEMKGAPSNSGEWHYRADDLGVFLHIDIRHGAFLCFDSVYSCARQCVVNYVFSFLAVVYWRNSQ
ncbi:hypothetical protein AKJ16_DCAP04166, partial [Drosera capensis]